MLHQWSWLSLTTHSSVVSSGVSQLAWVPHCAAGEAGAGAGAGAVKMHATNAVPPPLQRWLPTERAQKKRQLTAVHTLVPLLR
jgi:hypothetical protein